MRTTGLKAYNVTAHWTRIWSPAVIQDLQVGYNRSFITQSDPRENTDFNIFNSLGIAGIPAHGQTNGFPLDCDRRLLIGRRYDERPADSAG